MTPLANRRATPEPTSDPSFDGIRALLVGDVMLDRYLEGQVHRISPEAPVPVVALEREWSTPGGAGNVAAALAGLGCRVSLAGLIGPDEDGRRLRQALEEIGVEASAMAEDASLRTISKTRVVAGDSRQQVLRVDQDGDRGAFAQAAAALEERLPSMVDGHDVVILSDYDKGTVTQGLARSLIAVCRASGIPCVVDPKKRDFAAYAGATVLGPNLLEARRALGKALDNEPAIAEAAREAREAYGLDFMLITRGADGMTLATAEEVVHLPAEVREVADVTGAGDTVTAVLAACLGARRGIVEACRLASVAAGIAVSHPGCYVVRASELDGAARGLSPKVKGREAARHWAEAQRRAGRRVVFTNGCFDILHAGHLASLEQARRLGDALIVGLNSDASVRRNKGPSRPVVGERHRAALLAGLACVDAVVLFDELTPEALIEQVAPDVLVKGGDYEGKTIAGADFVRGRGGTVVTLPLVDGLSTTAILVAARSEPPA